MPFTCFKNCGAPPFATKEEVIHHQNTEHPRVNLSKILLKKNTIVL